MDLKGLLKPLEIHILWQFPVDSDNTCTKKRPNKYGVYPVCGVSQQNALSILFTKQLLKDYTHRQILTKLVLESADRPILAPILL